MDKRFFLALLLTAIVIVATPLLFPGATRRPVPAVVADTSARRVAAVPDSVATARVAPSPAVAANSTTVVPNAAPAAAVETTTVRAQRTTYAFSSRGGAPVSVSLDSYPSRRPTSGARKPVELARSRVPLTHYRLVLGRDTVALDTIALQADAQSATGANPLLTYAGVAAGHPVRLAYQFVPDSFIVRVRATVTDAPAGSSLLVDLPRTLASNEPDSVEDLGHLAVSYRTARGEVNSVGFGKVDSAETRVQEGPLTWVATRNKYFLVAYRADPKTPFTGLRLTGLPRHGKIAADMQATAAMPLANGSAGFDVYAGPQDSERLQRLGSDLDQVNPYGGWLNGVVQPVATIVVKVLLWVKRTTHLNYGWVLVIFGVIIRLALWPLNQGAMRTSMKMQRLAPEQQRIQKKYADDPKKQQEAIMAMYKEHGMSPLSPLMGCLPMLLPMPILFALYFVFQNTIEFRGVSFLWLPDISLHDPYYITPLLMGVSMFVMSWIGLKGSPPNPQAKMMSYMMPVVLTVVFLNFASGLNLYYAVQNIAALPQQWLLSRERAKQPPVVATTVQGPRAEVKRRS
jgi:YidC/Oxa1 family membrane protein insertase